MMLFNNLRSLVGFGLVTVLYVTSTSANPILIDSEQDSVSGRIIGSVEATPHEFPWQVSLEWGGNHICGGVIVSPTAVLTSAACANIVAISSIYVLAGRHLLNDTVENNVQKLSVSRITLHPAYPGGPNGQSNDIAVFKLLFPIEFNEDIGIIPMAEPGQTIPDTGIISGWGSPSEEALEASNMLRKADIPIISDADCEAVYEQDFDVDSMICAGNLDGGGVDFCTGDTGGPLMAQKADGSFYLIGISSWGHGCGQPNFPGVYTKVSYFLEFIQQNM